MSQYLRIVSYLYQYQNNVRGKNVGFIKAERREGMCRFQLQIPKYPEAADYSDCPVFFYGYRDFEPCLFPLTEVSIRNGQLSFRFTKQEQEIFDGTATLEAMEGILIVLSENTYLSSTWKELDGNDFFQLLHAAPGKTPPTALPSAEPLSLTEAAEAAATADSGLHSTEIQDKERNECSELPKAESNNNEVSDLPKNQDLSADMGESIFYNQRKQPAIDRSFDGTADKAADLQPAGDCSFGGTADKTSDLQPAGDCSFDGTANKTSDLQPADTSGSQTTENQKEPRPEDCRVTPDTIFSAYPKLPAFQNCKSCIRIEPQDIGILPMKHWGLAGNSFLLHGYYCFHHLLLARCDNDRYLLGVPGFYHPNEKIMAAMFGFDSFGTINQNPRQSGDFGYFYRMIE